QSDVREAIDRAGEEVRVQGVLVAEGAQLDDVDLRATEEVLIVRLQGHPFARIELREPERAKVHVLARPIRLVDDLVNILGLEVAIERGTQNMLWLRPERPHAQRTAEVMRPFERENERSVVGGLG